jgi:iron complex transport system permease protein
MNGKSNKRVKIGFLLIITLPVFVSIISLLIGSYQISFKDILKTFLSIFSSAGLKEIPEVYRDIILKIRLPRIILALTVGASLSVSGASLQALFRNPLVNEYILGISSGAAFGASLSIVFFGKGFPVELASFIFAFIAFSSVLFIAKGTGSDVISLLLTGVIVTAFFTSMLTMVEFLANPYSLQSLFFWLMGSLSLAGWKEVIYSIPFMLIGMTILFLYGWRMNVLSLGDEEAKALGLNVKLEKLFIMIATTIATSSAISTTGIIGWVGLIIPHISRMIFGVDNRKVIPASAFIGATFLLLADDFSRGITSFEIPVGIFTSIIGIPFFIYFLRKSGKLWA